VLTKHTLFASVVIGGLGIALVASAAHAQADFYKGKTVTIIVGSRAVGTMSFGAQLVARHLGKHIPGNPTVVLRQMPGGAHLVASGHVYNVTEPDGLTILAANPAIAMAQLFKMPAVRFDVTQYVWLGSSGNDGMMFGIRADLPYKTFKDLQNAKEELAIGTTGPGSNSHDVPNLLKEFAGAKFRLVTGYAANSDIKMAMERKESDGWSTLANTFRIAVEAGIARPMVRSRTTIPGYEYVAVDEDLTDDPVGKALMSLRNAPLEIGRPFAVRAGTPADRVAMLRDALAKVTEDPAFLADAVKGQVPVNHLTADAVTKAFAKVIDQTPEVLGAMHKYLKAGAD
jgi:tripartite-type tricarboxylate transporter receptor subunit TctC